MAGLLERWLAWKVQDSRCKSEVTWKMCGTAFVDGVYYKLEEKL